MTAVWFCLAAGIGAVLRHGVNQLGYSWKGTLAVNVVGSFVLGALLASEPSHHVLTVVGTGGCGSLTTFSMFSLEAIEAHGSTRAQVVGATVAGSLVAAALGYAVV